MTALPDPPDYTDHLSARSGQDPRGQREDRLQRGGSWRVSVHQGGPDHPDSHSAILSDVRPRARRTPASPGCSLSWPDEKRS